MNNSSEGNVKAQLDTDTNMFITVLANSEKTKPKNEIIHYTDEKKDDEEKIDSCIKDVGEQEENHNQAEKNEYHEEMNEIHPPVPPPIPPPQANLGNQLSLKTDEDVDEYDTATPVRQRLMKLDMLRKLSELVNKGVKLTQRYDMTSDYKLMKFEYELHRSIREKHGTVLFLQDGCVSAVGMLESANKNYNAFGLNLDGWTDSVSSKKEQLYDAIGNIYEKRCGPGSSLPPEIMLLGILGFSAARIHMVNKGLSNTKSLADKNKKDPNFLSKIMQQANGQSNHFTKKN
jgi:hypothetical protein